MKKNNIILALGIGFTVLSTSCQQTAPFKAITEGMDIVAVKDAGNFVAACGVEAVIRKTPSTKSAFKKAIEVIDVLVKDDTVSSSRDAVVTAITDELQPVFGSKVTEAVLEKVLDLYAKILERQANSSVDWREIALIVRAGIQNGITLSEGVDRPVYIK